MSALIFEPTDFYFTDVPVVTSQVIAAKAQARFDAWLKDAVRVYGKDAGCDRDNDRGTWVMKRHQVPSDTHTAILISIEEIKKEPCVHQPQIIRLPKGDTSDTWTNRTCKHCGVALVAKWEEAK